jgi:hypothetical protein
MKRAALFSALTGLRHCDIQKMQWKELQIDGDQARLNFTQQKTKGVEYMPISPQALELCGEPRKPNQLVFEDLPDPAWISKPLKRWVESAGIIKKITFHCFRHTFATLQLSNGTDIYTVSKQQTPLISQFTAFFSCSRRHVQEHFDAFVRPVKHPAARADTAAGIILKRRYPSMAAKLSSGIKILESIGCHNHFDGYLFARAVNGTVKFPNQFFQPATFFSDNLRRS